jgi:hypothetical protein
VPTLLFYLDYSFRFQQFTVLSVPWLSSDVDIEVLNARLKREGLG